MKYEQKTFLKENLCALKVFLRAFLSHASEYLTLTRRYINLRNEWSVCEHTRAQRRWNTDCHDVIATRFTEERGREVS